MGRDKQPEVLTKWYAYRRRIWWKRWRKWVDALWMLITIAIVIYGFDIIHSSTLLTSGNYNSPLHDYWDWAIYVVDWLIIVLVSCALALYVDYVRTLRCKADLAWSLSPGLLWHHEYQTTRSATYWFVGFFLALPKAFIALAGSALLLILELYYADDRMILTVSAIATLLVVAGSFFLVVELLASMVMRLDRLHGFWLWSLMVLLAWLASWMTDLVIHLFNDCSSGSLLKRLLSVPWEIALLVVGVLLLALLLAQSGKRPPKNWRGTV